MSNNIRSLRIPDEMYYDMKHLACSLHNNKELLVFGRVSISTIVRMALQEGIEIIKTKYCVCNAENASNKDITVIHSNTGRDTDVIRSRSVKYETQSDPTQENTNNSNIEELKKHLDW
jgi:hypothetical protein